MDYSEQIYQLKKIIEAFGNIVRLQTVTAGMTAENQQRERCGLSMAYDEKAFTDAIVLEQADVNSIATILYHNS